MFYATKIKSVLNGAAIDVNGKRLSFIGYLPVKAGDTVFTDGYVIFGNAPPKGSPAVFDNPSGIPVLADKSTDDKELRGYFDLRGNFKKYKIAGEQWIINDKKLFKHDDDEATIIDAEISDDGKLYTVEKKIINLGNSTDSNILFSHYSSSYYYRFQKQDYYSMIDLSRSSRGVLTKVVWGETWWALDLEDVRYCDYVKNTMPTVIQASRSNGVFTPPVFIDKDGDAIERDITLFIKKDAEVIEELKLSALVDSLEQNVIQSIALSLPNREFKDYLQSHANLLNFKILPNGKWIALIELEIGAERDFPHPEANLFEIIAGTVHQLEIFGYSSVGVHSLFLFKVDSNGNYDFLAQKAKFFPLWFINNIQRDAFIFIYRSSTAPTPPAPSATFPYTDWEWSYASSDQETGEKEIRYTSFDVYNSRYLPNAPDYDNPIDELSETFTFPVQDNFLAKLFNHNNVSEYWRLEGIYDDKGTRVCRGLFSPYNYHKCNLSFIELKGGDFLLGVHDDRDRDIVGNLYKISKDGDFVQVGEGLKNFRLRELKNINKAKR